MPGNTDTFTVTNAAYVEVKATIFTPSVSVAEDPSVVGWPTAGFTVKMPTTSADPIAKPAGAKHTFRKPPGLLFSPNERAGWIQTVSGTTTFQRVEAGQ